MKKFFFLRLPLFLVGAAALFSLLCSVVAVGVTNPRLMEQGFLSYAQTRHLSVSPTRYGTCAQGICDYLDGKTDAITWPEGGDMFSEKEMLHLRDVRGIVTFLKTARWVGGGAALLALAAGYALLAKYRRGKELLNAALRGFALASLFWLGVGAALAVWGAVNFEGLFVTFHLAAFSNDLWLLNPNTDLLIALMPLPFFTWYAGELVKSLLPVLGVMVCLPIAWLRLAKKEPPEGSAAP